MNLTHRQQQILDFIQSRIAHTQHGPPSLWEIAHAFGMRQTGGVRKHLQVLQKKGCLSLVTGTARGIRLQIDKSRRTGDTADKSRRTGDTADKSRESETADRTGDTANSAKPTRTELLLLPILGRVAAGAPIGAAPDPDAPTLAFARTLFAPQPDYLLRVKGDSMRDDGIFDGDLVAVQRSDTAENGQIVVARIDGEITIKRLQRTNVGGKLDIQLLPRNPEYAAIVVPANSDFAVIGRYCGLLRRA